MSLLKPINEIIWKFFKTHNLLGFYKGYPFTIPENEKHIYCERSKECNTVFDESLFTSVKRKH